MTLQLEFAIFADGSGVGSERWRNDFFAHRNAESRGWKQVLAILLSTREEAGPGVEGARVAIRELTRCRCDEVWIPSASMRLARARSLLEICAVGSNVPSLRAALDDMIQTARAEVEMLEPHLTAR